jgi:hypothetical protein
MILTIFESLHTAAGQAVAVEWDALCAYLAAPPEHPSKAACPLLKLATFGDVPSPRSGILRHDANVTSVWGVEGDHDDETVSPAQAADMLRAAGVRALVYTSPSHTPEKPRWRVLAPTSQAYAPVLRRELAGRVNAALGGCLRPESFALSQAFYFGRVAGVRYDVIVTAGQPVDLCGHLVPTFPTFEAAIMESLGPVEQQVLEAVEQGAQGFAGGWISSIMLDAFIADTLRMGGKLSMTKRREMLLGMGYVLHPGLDGGRTNNPVQPDGKKPQLWVRQGSGLEALRGSAEIARAYTAAQMVTTSRVAG